jgi:peptidyl-prolyl cis-trans isomerase B (cyclophilin B)
MQRIWQRFVIVVMVASALAFGGCAGQQAAESSALTSPAATTSTAPAASPSPSASPTQIASAPAVAPNAARLTGKATVEMVIPGGTVVMELDGANAPVTAGNFVDLVQKGFYNGLLFHRVVPDFVVQGGDPQGKDPNFPAEQLGTGSYTDPATKQVRYIPLEIMPEKGTTPSYGTEISQPPQLKHRRGALAMARSQFPDSASSQFYVTLADVNFLDGKYAVFGYVTSGMDAIDKVKMGDRITSIKVTQGGDNFQAGR